VRARLQISILWMCGGILFAPPVSAQTGSSTLPAPGSPLQRADQLSVRGPTAEAPPTTLIYNNRPITELRASILARTPVERAAAAVHVLDQLVESGSVSPVTTRSVGDGVIVVAGGLDAFAILPADVDELTAETLDQKALAATARLQTALHEAVELRTPRRLAQSGAAALLATAIFIGLLLLLHRGHAGAAGRLTRAADRRLERFPGGEVVRATRVLDLMRHAVTLISVVVGLLFAYSWLTFVLRRFPYTRPWGESLREFLLGRAALLGRGILHAVPDLFTVVLIVLITRFAVRLSNLIFEAVERGTIAIPMIYPETAQPTRRLVAGLLWVFALALSYPYLPGSNTDAFKGVSVFVGLMISLGSSGIVNQVMSGLTLTYSRALHIGDFVKIGDHVGTVVHMGSLSTKLKTGRREEVTIPNAVVVSQTTTNYSKHANSEGVYVPTSITIGYDSPWRQVHALLLLAAERTAGIRREPKPRVLQTALQDFYVQYTLQACLEQPHLQAGTLATLHANIQDAFNEYGVQIMSPNYEADPADSKTVPREKWYAAPACPPGECSQPVLEPSAPTTTTASPSSRARTLRPDSAPTGEG
jgi:small-conductance mechanosensitive channel